MSAQPKEKDESLAPKAPRPETGHAHAGGVLPHADDHTLPPLTPEQEAARRRARNAAIVSIATFVGALVGIDQGYRASQMSRRLAAESQNAWKSAAFTEGKDDADVAMTGDSRVLHGFAPHAVEKDIQLERGETLHVYNAGLSGAPPMAQLAFIRRMLGRAHKPRVVLLSISPYMFSSRIYAPTARDSLTSMYRLVDLPAVVRAGAPAEDVLTVLNEGLFESMRFRPRVLELFLKQSGYKEVQPVGDQGFLQNGEVDPATQDVRARARAQGYRTEMWKPDAHFGNEQQGFFLEALRELRADGVKAIVLNSISASQLDATYGKNSIYDEHIAWVRAQAERFGAQYLDVKRNPAVRDEDFNDGDHLGGEGAGRFSVWLAHEVIVPALGGPKSDRPASCRSVFDFEDGSLAGWTRTGDAFASPIAQQGRRGQTAVYGIHAHSFFTSFTRLDDRATGEALSPEFTLDGGEVRVRVAGGAGDGVEVALLVDGEARASARGRNDEILRDVTWSVAQDRGKKAQIRVRDKATAAWGHVEIDDVAVCP